MLSSETRKDLVRSGLTSATIEVAQIEDPDSNPLLSQVLAKHRIQVGYRIPYFTFEGLKNGYWAIKNLGSAENKYLRPKKLPPHLYIPPKDLMPAGWHRDPSVALIVTEGEKKALAAAQHGWPTVGLGGIWSWRRTIATVKKDKLTQVDDETISIDLTELKNPTSKVIEEFDTINWVGRDVTIVFDSDRASNPDIQSASFELALELQARGSSVIQFCIDRVPDIGPGKIGLDDFLLEPGNRTILENPPAEALIFPTPANPRNWITEQLNRSTVNREGQERVANVALAVLDEGGSRYRDPADTFYYFERGTKILHPFDTSQPGQLRTTTFGALLVQDLGLKTQDNAVMSRLLDEYTTRSPIETIVPRRAVATLSNPDRLYFQVSDGRQVRVSSRGFKFIDNGADGVLFYPGATQGIDEDLLKHELRRKRDLSQHSRWFEALQTVNLQPLSPLTLTETQILLSCLFYMSPWLQRWRGLQLPLEVAVAEPNSGKTFLYNLRRGVLTGSPGLEGLPDDFRGWVSAVTAAPGIWVCDNLGSVRSDYWHRLNDELARLITDPDPSIELRRLYTTSSVSRIPIHSSFAITTIKNPFSAPDIIQRSLVYSLHAIPAEHRKSTWYSEKMADRAGWLAEHLQVIRAFFQSVDESWDEQFLSGFRLVHFDQALLHIGRVMGWETQVRRIVKLLPTVVAEAVAEYDPVVEALKAFVGEFEEPIARVNDVVQWASQDPEERYVRIKTLSNSILLGRYIRSHEYDVEQSTGITVDRMHNQTILRLPVMEVPTE